MWLLTDCPEKLAGFVPEQARWSRLPCSALSPADRRLYGELGLRTEPWAVETGTEAEAEIGIGIGIRTGAGRSFWSRAVVVDEAPRSQFDVLRELASERDALASPIACLALTGRDHHGLAGRPWVVRRGNLHLSVALPAGRAVDELAPALIMLPAVAIVQSVAVLTSSTVDARIKWVNDVVVGYRKIAGAIAATHTQGSTVESAVLGIGLNVAEAPMLLPTPTVPEVGSLTELAGSRSPPPSLAAAWTVLLAVLAHRYVELLDLGPARLLDDYRRYSALIGKRVRIYEDAATDRAHVDWPTIPPPLLGAGVVEEIDQRLGLVLSGKREPIMKGRLVLDEVARRFGLP